MKLHLYLLTASVGLALALHLAMNGKVGQILDNARVGNALFWCIGGVCAVIIGLTGLDKAALGRLRQIPWYLLTAGAIGGFLVFLIAWLIPRIGAGPAMVIMLSGQVAGGTVMSHFGWLGSPLRPVGALQLCGVAVMVCGVLLATLSK